MNDKELAKKLKQFGAEDCGNYRWIDADVIDSLPIDEFVRDWRVAGALMEKCDDVRCLHNVMRELNFAEHAHYPLPRAIIEACVEALDGL